MSDIPRSRYYSVRHHKSESVKDAIGNRLQQFGPCSGYGVIYYSDREVI